MAAAAVLWTGLLAVAGSWFLPPDAFWITDGGNKWMVLVNFLRHGTAEMVNPAAALDPDNRLFPDAVFHFQMWGGAVRSVFPEVFPVLCAPLFAWLGFPGLYLPAFLGGVLTVFFAVKSFRSVPQSVMTAALSATPLLFYSVCFWEMTPALAFAMASLWCFRRDRSGAAGAVLALGLWLRPEMYFLAAAWGAALLREKDWRSLRHFAAGFAAALLPYWVFQWWSYGNLLGIHGAGYYTHNAAGETVTAFLCSHLANYQTYFFRFAVDGAAPWWCWFAVLAAALTAGYFRSKSMRYIVLAASLVLGAVDLTAFYRTPEMVMASVVTIGLFPGQCYLIGAAAFWRDLLTDRNRFCRMTAGMVAAFLVLVPPLLTSHDMGIIWGPRHFLFVLIPVMGLYLRQLLRQKDRWMAVLAAGTLLIAVLLQLCGVTALHTMKTNNRMLTEFLAEKTEYVVVSDLYFLPMQTPERFFDRRWLYVSGDDDLPVLLESLAAGNVKKMDLIVSQNPSYRALSNGALQTLLRQWRVTAPPEVISLPGTAFLEVAVFHLAKK